MIATAPLTRIALRRRDNHMTIHCPTVAAVNDLTDYLTFVRPVTERYHGRLVTRHCPEPCYQRSASDPFVLSCPAGFERMLVSHFKMRYDFSVTQSRSARIAANTQADRSQLNESEFRKGQRPILEAMLAADGGRIVVAPAVGKSFLIARYAKALVKARILVSTKHKAVLLQLYEDLHAYLPGQVGLVCSGKNIAPEARIVCVSQGTLARYFPREERQNVDVLIVDEYHEWGSRQKLEILERVREAKLFGLSANKIREDGAHFRLDGFFGPVIAEMDHAEAVARKLVAPICVVWVPVHAYRDPIRLSDQIDQRQRYGLWQYPQRNRLIASVARMFNEEEQVLISVKKIEHALYIRQYLPEFTVVHGVQNTHSSNLGMFEAMGLTHGLPPMTSERLQNLKKRFSDGTLKKVIATDVWKHGVNFPHLSVVIRAEGTDSIVSDTQWPGRTSRLQEGKSVGLVFDFTDEYDHTLWRKAVQRQQRYSQQNYKQITLAELGNDMNRLAAGGV